MAPSKRIVIHHVRGRLSGLRRIIGHTLVEAAPISLMVENGEMVEVAVGLEKEHERYVLYRELNTPSILKKETA